MTTSIPSPVPSPTERFFSTRFSMVLVVAFAIVALAINELSNANTRQLIRAGAELTDARVAAQEVYLAVTEAESAQRGFLITRNQDHLKGYEAAWDQLQKPLGTFQRYFSERSAHSSDLKRLPALIGAKRESLDQGMTRAISQGEANADVILAQGKALEQMQEIRGLMNTLLEEASASTTELRAQVLTSLQLIRVAIIGLILIALTGVWGVSRQFRREQLLRASQRDDLRTEVAARTSELQALAHSMLSIQETERHHLARELHDELGGLLTTVKLDLARIKAHNLEDEWLRDRLKRITERLNEVIALKRRMIETLRPSTLDYLGLHAALSILCSESGESMGIPVEASLVEVDAGPELNLTLYRFVQESLVNVARHAQASRVIVNLARDNGNLRVQVIDDGKGFDEHSARVGHHGLAGMRFRIETHRGEFHVHSQAGQGTTVEARVPFPDSFPGPTPTP